MLSPALLTFVFCNANHHVKMYHTTMALLCKNRRLVPFTLAPIMVNISHLLKKKTYFIHPLDYRDTHKHRRPTDMHELLWRGARVVGLPHSS